METETKKEKPKNEKYKCQKCGIYLSNITNYRYHTQKNICQKDETNRKIYKCDDCLKIFAEKKNLDYHIKHAVCTKKAKINKENIDFIEDVNNEINTIIDTDEVIEDEINIVDTNEVIEQENTDLSNEEKENLITNKINLIVSSLDLNNFEQIMNTLTNIEYELKKKNDKTKKQKIPATLKAKVWNHWIGEEIGKIKCLCCDNNYITQSSFSCGHIIPESKGGELSIYNLKPICHLCNSSMYNTNMNEFVAKFNLNKQIK